MRIQLIVTVDESMIRSDRILEELETAMTENEGIGISTAGARFSAALQVVQEVGE